MANRKNSMSWSLKASTVRTLAWDLESRKEPCWVPCLLIVNDISNDITSNIIVICWRLPVVWSGTQFRRCNQSPIWSGQIGWMGKVVANGLQPIKVLRSTRSQNQVSFYTPIDYAWSYRTGCRPLSLPRSFFRGPILEATKQRSHCCSGSRKDSFRI